MYPSTLRSAVLFQRLENLFVDLIHVEGLEIRKGSFHPEKRNDRFVDSLDDHYKIPFVGLFFVNFHNSSIPHRLDYFVGSSLEGTSLLAGFHGHDSFFIVGSLCGRRCCCCRLPFGIRRLFLGSRLGSGRGLFRVDLGRNRLLDS